ncbi:EAL domain-containing protein [Aliikangiella marina]|uniref:cyclic-guanylate-specific phosphodiesterase n=1 Tax=Aliikangiella marina TaxID=1712262 RepID=A0A545T558_9GAMM|nr:EAL domain-containing protein [Aliikangiella marina]TQV72371.1 EAL domain-containing protein [Aliikangiella marina]
MSISKSNRPSLLRRILILFAVLLAIVSVLVAGTTLQAAFSHSEQQLLKRFETSQQVFTYKLLNDASTIKGALNSAAKDFNTKQLIASAQDDPESLKLALINLQNRLNTDFTIIFDEQKRPLTATAESVNLELTSILDKEVQLLVTSKTIYLIEFEEVRFLENQPNPDAWMVMGMDISRIIDSQVRELTGFELSVVARNKTYTTTNKEYLKIASELSRLPLQAAAPLMVGGTEKYSYHFGFNSIQSEPISLVFSITESSAYLNFFKLMWQLIVVVLVSILIAFFLAFYFAKGVTRPLRQLSGIANKIQVGEYDTEVPSFNSQEVNNLSEAFTAMRDAINHREQRIEKLAYYDELTGLPNRTAFRQQLDKKISTEPNTPCAIMLLDIDRFTEVNDTLGHEFGDKLLCEISRRMQGFQPKHAFYSRVGGDEFAILLNNLSDFELNTQVEQFFSFFEIPFEIDGVLLDIDISAGVALYPEQASKSEALIQAADIALNKCKASHKGFVVYDKTLNTHSIQRLNLMSELRSAIETSQLSLYYQPKLDLETNQIVSVECLVRWIHPEHGFIGPDDFIPLAEQTGAIRDLTKWAIQTALSQHKSWTEQGNFFRVAINISALDLIDLSLPAYVAQQLSELSLDTTAITLEVTESAIMSEPDQAIRALDILKRMGIKLSIDDFGTGYSSMAQLKIMPVSELKIDKSFVLDLATNEDDATIVKSIADLAHNLDMTIVAEGVEDKDSLEKLKEYNVEQAQGYFIAKPMPADDFNEWYSNSNYRPR